ncbi:MAG TPA: RpiB/LacA/LacB family sugar-phosphate isomerase [Candidatus Competibacteraceae bacterium]|nr:RpiB/LacA/LacB family sugar-phosphate isomerase [Candidatus Competibacteraceae bacterium]
MQKVVIGCDAYGYRLKESVKQYLIERGLEVDDVGVYTAQEPRPYYEVAMTVAARVAHNEIERGLLVCGSGMGMAIIANKFPGVYAAVCENRMAAERARSINNANVLTLGEFVTSPEAAREVVDAWLDTEFASGWEPAIQAFLHRSLGEIQSIEQRVVRDFDKTAE